MSYQELVILLPCHSLEDFPQHHEGEDAEGLLAGWTALWHPQLLERLSQGPQVHRADDPPADLSGKLIVVPSVSSPELPADFSDQARTAGACLIQNQTDRMALLDQAWAAAGISPSVDSELAADFHALGYCYLQTQLLTRQMRYSSNLDEGHFFKQLLAAARAAVEGDRESADAKLSACFDSLAEERDHYYSVDAYLIDLTLVEPEMNERRLQEELEIGAAINLLASADTLRHIATTQPALFEKIRQKFAAGGLGVVGGGQSERALPLLSCEAILSELKSGAETYQALLGQPVKVFGRRRFGLSPMLPQILDKLGYQGALHFTLEDGRFPQGTQAKTRWEGCDGTAIDSIAKVPLNADCAKTFLGFAHRLGESMDMDHVATLCLAHWPGQTSVGYEDLRRCARFGAALGRFVTLDEYFRETHMPGYVDRFEADKYRSPYLRQALNAETPNALSSQVEYWRQQAEASRESGLTMLAESIGKPLGRPDARNEDSDAAAAADSSRVEPLMASIAQGLLSSVGQETAAYLVVNPATSARRMLLDVSRLDQLPDVAKPVFAAAEQGTRKLAIVDVPGIGFTWVMGGSGPSKPLKSAPPLAEDLRERDGVLALRNEYFEAFISPTTGAIQSLKDYTRRSNRLSQQIAFRHARPPHENNIYSTMVADKTEVTHSGGVLGEIVAKGRLVNPNGDNVGLFEQTVRVHRGSRVLELDIALDSLVEPGADPWKSYFGCRFAWADEAAQIFRSVHEARLPTEARRCEAPHYIEIDTGDSRTAILTGGLPYHQRVGPRMIDTLLVVRGEQQRRFRLGIGVDVASPLDEANRLLAPPLHIARVVGQLTPPHTGWLFHFDKKSVVVTAWEPISSEGRRVGVRLRLLETQGASVQTRLSCFRDLCSARRIDFRGRSLGDCRVEGGRVHLELAPSEWSEFEVFWAEDCEDVPSRAGGCE